LERWGIWGGCAGKSSGLGVRGPVSRGRLPLLSSTTGERIDPAVRPKKASHAPGLPDNQMRVDRRDLRPERPAICPTVLDSLRRAWNDAELTETPVGLRSSTGAADITWRGRSLAGHASPSCTRGKMPDGIVRRRRRSRSFRLLRNSVEDGGAPAAAVGPGQRVYVTTRTSESGCSQSPDRWHSAPG